MGACGLTKVVAWLGSSSAFSFSRSQSGAVPERQSPTAEVMRKASDPLWILGHTGQHTLQLSSHAFEKALLWRVLFKIAREGMGEVGGKAPGPLGPSAQPEL